MNLRYINFYLCMMVLIASFVVAPKVQAQMAFNFNLGQLGQANIANSVDQMQALLELRVEEIDGIVELEDKQVGQLKLAAKVVAKRVFGQRQGAFLAPRGKTQSDGGDEESFSDQDEESKSNAEAGNNPLQRLRGGALVSTALDHKTWKSAVKSILTDQQQASLAAYSAQRSNRLRDVVVQYRTWEFVKSLRLHDDQIEPVAEIVDRIEGDELVKQLGRARGVTIIAGGAKRPKVVAPDDLKDVLSTAQMQAFKNLRSRNRNPRAVQLMGRLNQVPGRTLENRGVGLDSKAARPTVETVASDSFFEKMGVKVGDIIDEVNGKPVDTLVQINRALRTSGKIALTIVRNGKSIQLDSNK